MEIWKDFRNSKYSVSSYGRVRSNKRTIIRSNGRRQIINEKILTPVLNTNGYYKVRLNLKKGVQKNLMVHSLVMQAFLGFVFKDYTKVINHIDGNKLNNRLDNLEIISQKGNVNHAWDLGLSSNNHSTKKILFDKKIFNSILECEKITSINRNTLAKCAKNGYFLDVKYKVVYNGIKFNSLKEASRSLGLNPKTIAKYGKVIKPKKIKVEWITL